MVNSISSTNGAATANPTLQEIKRFLIPLSFLERISLIVKGIFSKDSKDSFKSLCGIKYGIKADYINHSSLAKKALKVVYAKREQIRKSDITTYLQLNFRVERDIYIYRGEL